MRVLLIDCYDDGAVGRSSFEAFETIIRKALATAPARTAVAIPKLFVRKPYDLTEFSVDYEFGRIDESAKKLALKFDSLNLIIVAGDSMSLPWDPKYLDVISMIWCAQLVGKPILCCGFGAIASVYASATQGVRFNVLNRHQDGTVEDLPSFTRFAKSSGQHPGAFYDSETGDLYTYSTQSKAWSPLLNIGIYHSPESGEPFVGKLRPKPKHLSSGDHMLPAMPGPDMLDEHEEFVQVTARFANHFIFKSIPQQCFSCTIFPEYFLNGVDSLPRNGFGVAAETRFGPLILVNEFSLVFAAEIGKLRKHRLSRHIVRDYIHELIEELGSRPNGCIGSLLVDFLFGSAGDGQGGYDPVKHKKAFAPPSLTQSVPSTLADGPMLVDNAAARYVAEYQALVSQHEAIKAMAYSSARGGSSDQDESHVHVSEISGPSRSSAVSPRPVSPRTTLIREPDKNRKKRLEDFLIGSGQKRLIKINAQSRLQELENDNASTNRDSFSASPSYALHGVETLQLTPKVKKRPTSAKSDDSYTSDKSGGSSKAKGVAAGAVTGDNEDRRSNLSQTSSRQSKARSNSRGSRASSPHDNTPHVSRPGTTEVVSPQQYGGKNAILPMTFPRQRPRSAIKDAPKVHVPSNAGKPYNSLRHYEELAKKLEEEENREYKGTFATVYMTDLERQLHEHKTRKQKFIAGDFRRHFGKPSELKPTDIAAVTHVGPYPDKAPALVTAPAKDWITARQEHKHKHIAGPWV